MKDLKMEVEKRENGSNLPPVSFSQAPIYLKAKFLLIVVLVVALGLLAVNQGLGFFYKAHLLKAPCDLCADLNPEVKQCIDYLNNPRASYWGANGWSDPFNETQKYNLTIYGDQEIPLI